MKQVAEVFCTNAIPGTSGHEAVEYSFASGQAGKIYASWGFCREAMEWIGQATPNRTLLGLSCGSIFLTHGWAFPAAGTKVSPIVSSCDAGCLTAKCSQHSKTADCRLQTFVEGAF